MRSFRIFAQSTMTILLTALVAGEIPALGLKGYQGRLPEVQTVLSQATHVVWPWPYATLQTGIVNASFTDGGLFGKTDEDLYGPPPPPYSFETPPGSGVEYLYAGALWVGGIVGQDTLVSVAFDGWQRVYEIHSTNMYGTVFPFSSMADSAFQAEFADTARTFNQDFLDHRPHKPLGLRIINRAQIITSSPANNCIFYDVAVTNIGQNHIEKGYIGLYLDGDVGGTLAPRSGDDLAGSIQNRGVGYIIDNDGDGLDGFGSTKILACKILSTSFPSPELSFNWWVTSPDITQDFGPQSRARVRVLGTGGWGSPEGDRNKYAYLSNGEWDYDQIRTNEIDSTDPVWTLPGQALALDVSRGRDTRFLLSAGPFDLDPDSSIHLQYVMFTADSIHIDPLNFQHTMIDTFAPDLYLQALNFSGVLRNALVADSIAPMLISSMNPPSGFHLTSTDSVSVHVRWDTLFNQGVDGYNIYATEVPDSLFANSSTLPPWASEFRTDEPVLYATVGREGHVSLLLSPCHWYAIQIASREGTTIGPLGRIPVFARLATESTPVLKDTVLFARDGQIPEIEWNPTPTPASKIRLYKFTDTVLAMNPIVPHYSLDSLLVLKGIDTVRPVDTQIRGGREFFYYAMSPFREIEGTATSWQDSDFVGTGLYRLTAVDSCGFESGCSPLLRINSATRSRDVLVIYARNVFNVWDSIPQFYNRILDPSLTHDLYNFTDSIDVRQPTNLLSILMRYSTVLVDGNLWDGITNFGFSVATVGQLPFPTYLNSGGRLVCFGGFNGTSVVTPQAPYDSISTSKVLPRVRPYFNIDSITFVSPFFYESYTDEPYVDTLFGFRGAVPMFPGLPSMSYDTTSISRRGGFTESKTGDGVATLCLTDTARILYRYESNLSTRSRFQDKPVGVVTHGNGFDTYVFGFHLHTMVDQDASQLINWIINRVPTAVDQDGDRTLPASFSLGQNYPNPFNPSTRIRFELPRASQVKLDVYNLLGQKVVTLVDKQLTAGAHTADWNGRNAAGRAVASGIYLYRIEAGSFIASKKMILLK